jgi:sirohydrochlorin ferrochelatase
MDTCSNMTQKLKFLLLVAHGSRREASNDEIRCLVEQLKVMDQPFADIGCAFLEIAMPSIPQALHAFIARGARDIVVLPYFLSAGKHVTVDIPAQIELVQTQYPMVRIATVAYLGASETMAELVLKQTLKYLK